MSITGQENRSSTVTDIPELEPCCGSWIVTAPSGRVYEIYDRRNVELVARDNWKIETALQYLGRINQA